MDASSEEPLRLSTAAFVYWLRNVNGLLLPVRHLSISCLCLSDSFSAYETNYLTETADILFLLYKEDQTSSRLRMFKKWYRVRNRNSHCAATKIKFNIIHSVHCACNHLYTATYPHNKIISYPSTLLSYVHVSAINRWRLPEDSDLSLKHVGG